MLEQFFHALIDLVMVQILNVMQQPSNRKDRCFLLVVLWCFLTAIIFCCATKPCQEPSDCVLRWICIVRCHIFLIWLLYLAISKPVLKRFWVAILAFRIYCIPSFSILFLRSLTVSNAEL
jgi:hypothetical protein